MAGNFGYVHLAVAIIAGLAIGAALMAFLPRSGSYDECMLQQMRGQPPSSFRNAFAVCRAQFPE
jgi:hypothetical protein